MELLLFGRGYQTGLIPEGEFVKYVVGIFDRIQRSVISFCIFIVVMCLLFALFAAGRVHGVCFTTWSVGGYYFIPR